VRLFKAEELPRNAAFQATIEGKGRQDAGAPRVTAWETVHHPIRVLGTGGEAAAAELVAKLGAKAEAARELACRLFALCERKKRATEAQACNGLVQSWPELVRLAQEGRQSGVPNQEQLL
jgi:putative DNA methylase